MNYDNIKKGIYNINGKSIYFRSKWEANIALYLDWLVSKKEIKEWGFEKDKFVFDKIQFGTRSYLPDFKITNNDNTVEYYEVKGYMDKKSATKLKRMKKYYPKIKITLIERDFYTHIQKQVGRLLKFY